MANPYVNKIIYNGTTLIDLTGDDASPATVLSGNKFHGADGSSQTGTCAYDADTSDADASASDILSSKTAYKGGSKLTGTMANNGGITGSITTKAQEVSIASGYHDGSGKVSISSTEQAKIISANIKNGISVLGVTGSLESMEEVATESEMDGKLVAENVGNYYKYTGTTGKYTNGDVYRVYEVSPGNYGFYHYGENSPTGIAVTTPPTKTSYGVGDTLDLTGMVVTVTYQDGTTKNITSECTFDPVEGTTLALTHTSVAITWEGFSTSQAITVSDMHCYGVEWDGTATTSWTRTDDAASFTDPVPYVSGATSYSSPFDSLMPWSGMTVVTDSEAGQLVKIPKFWYKWTRDGVKMKLQIADRETTGFYVSPAHADRGDGSGERDYVYIGRYHCSTSDYKSTTGVKPKVSITRAIARSVIASLGTTIWQSDFAMMWTVNMLYLVEFADWNSQAKIGYGCGDGSSVGDMGYTDSMPYHTGTTQTSRTTYGCGTQYRYIEGWWDNVYEWVDGIYFSSSKAYCIANPSSFSDTTGGTKVGTISSSSGVAKTWTTPTASGFEYALIPSETTSDSTYSTYVCDRCSVYSSEVVLFRGGQIIGQVLDYGAFFLSGDPVSSSYTTVGTRLMKLP